MSLINQMLQDLERRRADEATLARERTQARAVPPAPRMHVAWWLALALLAALIGLGLWTWRHVLPAAAHLSSGPSAVIDRPGLPAQPTVSVPAAAPLLAPSATPVAAVTGGEPFTAAASPATEAGQAAVAVVTAAPEAVQPLPLVVAAAGDTAAIAAPAAAPAPEPARMPERQREVSGPVSPPPVPSSKDGKAPVLASAATRKPAPRTVSVTADEGKAGTAGATNGSTEPMTSGAPASKKIQALTPQEQAENLFRKAVQLLQQGDPAAAQAALEQSLQTDPRHTAARQTLAGVLLDAKRPQAAIETLQTGLQLDPTQAGMAMILARVQVENGELAPALATLRNSLPYASERADYQAFLAALLQRGGHHLDAIEHYRQALRKAPDNGLWWMGLAISLRDAARPAEAREAFNRAAASKTLTPQLQAFVEQQLR